MIKRLYNWVLNWAQTKHAKTALFLIAFVESSFFPIPPDILLIAIVLSKKEEWFRAALICLLGSVIGGLLGYWIGWQLWSATSGWFFQYVFSEDVFGRVQMLYRSNDFWAVFIAGFTPIPYKVFTIAGGVAQINLPVFIGASILSRGGRFFLVAGLIRIFGPRVKELIDRYFNLLTILFTILLVGGFVALKFLASQ